MRLFGRDKLAASIRASTKRVTILAGDPGVGKTALLESLTPDDTRIVVPVVASRYSGNALLQAYAASLAEAAVLVAESMTAPETVSNALAGVLSRLQKAGRIMSVETLATIFWGVVGSRIGTESAAILRDGIRTALGREPTYEERIIQALPADTLSDLNALASDLAKMATPRGIIIRIDKLELISDEEFLRLLDLTTALPEGIHLAGCWSTIAATIGRLDRITAAGGQVVEVPALDAATVGEWLSTTGIQADVLPRLMRITGGNAYWVDSAIQFLRAGRDLDEVAPDEQQKAINRTGYFALSDHDQTVVALLLAFTDPPSASRTAAYLGIDQGEWATTEARLVRLRILGTLVGARPWFHELLRRHLWADVLSEGQRSEASARALVELAESTRSDGASPAVASEAASLALYAHSLLQADRELAFLATCGRQELAVVGALLELSEPNGPEGTLGAVTAQGLLAHAMERFGIEEDLLGPLRRLAQANLLYLHEETRGAAVIRIWRSWPATLVAVGRIAKEYGTFPLQSAASTVFETFMRPRFGAMTHGVLGVGRIDLVRLLRDRDAIPEFTRDGARLMRREKPTIIAQAKTRELSIAVMAAYVERQDLRTATIEEGPIPTGDGPPVDVEHVFRLPTTAIPSRRFVRAAERILKQSLGSTFGTSISAKSPSSASLDELMTSQAAVLEAVRLHASQLECAALGLLRPTGYLYGTRDGGSIVAEVQGMSGARRADIPAGAWGPFSRLEWARSAGLHTDQTIGDLSIRSYERNSQDGPMSAVTNLHKRAAAFNQSQDRLVISLDQERLQTILEAAEQLTRADAAFLAPIFDQLGELSGGTEFGRAVFVLLWPSIATNSALFDDYLGVLAISWPSAMTPAVRVQILSAPPRYEAHDYPETQKLLIEHFGYTEAVPGYETHGGFARPVFADLLGYLDSELDLPDRGEALRLRRSGER